MKAPAHTRLQLTAAGFAVRAVVEQKLEVFGAAGKRVLSRS